MQYLISTPEPPSDQQIFQALIVWQDRLVMLSTECEGSIIYTHYVFESPNSMFKILLGVFEAGHRGTFRPKKSVP